MLPFGGELFGRWFFGHGNWARRALWENVPGAHRDADEHGYLERLLKAYGDSLEEFRRAIRDLPLQREPYLVRGEEGEGEWFFVKEIREETHPDYGKILRLIGEADFGAMPNTGEPLSPPPDEPTWDRWFPWYPYKPISQVGPDWWMMWQGVEYSVVAVRTRNYDQPAIYDADTSLGNEVWVRRGDTYPFKFEYDDVRVGVGDGTASPLTVLPELLWLLENVTPSPAPWLTDYAGLEVTVVFESDGLPHGLYDVPNAPYDGTGALWIEDPLNPGEILVGPPGTEWGTVDYRSGRVELSLQGGEVARWFDPIVARFRVKGFFFKFKPVPLVNSLARDFGIENDLNDPEFVQRSTIANLTKYFGLKSTWDSYRIRGEVSGFRVNAQALYAICDCDLLEGFPADHVFYYDGECYTDLPPRYIRFEDISADVLYYRWESGLPWTNPPPLTPGDPADGFPWKTLVDASLMFEDASPDGMNDALGFALDVCQGYYLGDAFHGPCHVVSTYELDPLDATDAAVLAANGLSSAWRVQVRMTPVQKQVFNFKKGCFGLTEYEGTNYPTPTGYPPSLSDFAWWIDADEGYDPVSQTWTVLISSASVPEPLSVSGKHIAVRYWPELWRDCCYCKSYKIRVEIEPMPDSPSASEYYKPGVEMQAAIERLIWKIKATLIPIHVRIVEFAVQFYDCVDDFEPEVSACDINVENVAVVPFCYYYDWVGEIADDVPTDFCSAFVTCSLTVVEHVDRACLGLSAFRAMSWFAGSPSQVLMDIDQQGDYTPVGASQDIYLRDQAFAVVWSLLGVNSGVPAPGWGNVLTGLDVTALIAGSNPATIQIDGSATLPCPTETRFTFEITP